MGEGLFVKAMVSGVGRTGGVNMERMRDRYVCSRNDVCS